MVNWDLNKAGCNKAELAFSILLYADKIRPIQELSKDIQVHSEACVRPVYSEPWYNKDPSKNQVYSESWYIEDNEHIHDPSKHLR